jgi:hypothetical protein
MTRHPQNRGCVQGEIGQAAQRRGNQPARWRRGRVTSSREVTNVKEICVLAG